MTDDIVVFRLKRPNYALYIVFGLLLLIIGVGFFILLAALVAKIAYDNTFIEVTGSSVRLRKRIHITEIPFSKINSVTMEVLSPKHTYGTIIVSLGNDIAGLRLRNVDKVRELNELLQTKISATTYVAAKVTAPDRLRDLERLAGLRTSGALTELEYLKEKARLLK